MSSGSHRDRAIAELLETHGGRLYRIGLRICGNHEDAEELVQETFLSAYRAWDQYRGDAAPLTWLYRIASRVCQRQKRLRAGQPRTMTSLSVPDLEGENFVLELPQPGESPEEAQARRELWDVIEEAIGTLPLDFRMPLVLKEIAELPVATIAEILEVKPATIKTRVHRGRLLLRQALTERLPRRRVEESGPVVCADLLTAKQEALDRGVEFPVPDELLSERCRSFFATLDLGQNACRAVAAAAVLPEDLRRRLDAEMARPGHADPELVSGDPVRSAAAEPTAPEE